MEREPDGPATSVLNHIENVRAQLRKISNPSSRVDTARAVRANAKKYESLVAEIVREAVHEMRASKMSYGQIAAELGISRTRVQQLLGAPK